MLPIYSYVREREGNGLVLSGSTCCLIQYRDRCSGPSEVNTMRPKMEREHLTSPATTDVISALSLHSGPHFLCRKRCDFGSLPRGGLAVVVRRPRYDVYIFLAPLALPRLRGQDGTADPVPST